MNVFPDMLGPFSLARFTESLRSEHVIELHLMYHTALGERIDAAAYVNKEAYAQNREATHAALLDQARTQVPAGLMANPKAGCKPC